ncbi:MAG: Ig-like domain-containing protein [Gemmatimonadaceae bacterium]
MTILKLRVRPALLGGAVLAVVCACAGDGATGPVAPSPAIPALMEAATSTAFSGMVGTRAAVPPSVRLKDAAGSPVEGALVSFSVSHHGGTIGNASARTDANGLASVGEWNLGIRVGEHTVTAMSGGLSNVVFTAAVARGPAARLLRVNGYGQSGPVGSALPAPLRVHVTDAFDNPAAGVQVTFAVTSGGGTISAVEAVTDSAGSAVSGAWTLGPSVGPQMATARMEALQVEFSAHAIAAVCETSASCGVTGHIAFGRADGIYRANADGSGVMLLVPNAGGPAWSPNGSRIAFSRQVDGRGEIHVVNADGSGVTRRSNTPGRSSWSPAWSPDGRKLAFTALETNGIPKIYMVSADEDGTTPVLLFTPSNQQWLSPISWSPDGAKIAFTMSGGVHILNADGTGLTRLTPPGLPYFVSRVAWSPDGLSLAVTTEENCNWDYECELGLAIVDAKTAAVRTLVAGSAVNQASDPAWSPDGKTIAYTQWQCSAQCSRSVRFVKADGSAQGVITQGFEVAWRP